jgi:hypothetical protein
LEQRIAQLEREKTALESMRSTSRADAETAQKATRLEKEVAKAEKVEARRQVDAKKKELEETKSKHQAARQTISIYRNAVCASTEPLQTEVGELL